MKIPKLKLKYDSKKNAILVNTDFVFYMKESWGLEPETLMKILSDKCPVYKIE